MTAAELIALMMRLPPTHYLEIGVETNTDGKPFFAATLFERCPEDGWPNHRHPPSQFDDKPVAFVSVDVGDTAKAIAGLESMLQDKRVLGEKT